MKPALAAALRSELDLAQASRRADPARAFVHLERAHILAQRHTAWHVRVHLRMLGHGWRCRDVREIIGQSFRIVAALLFSRIWVPAGNTGGANVSAFRPMPIPTDLQPFLD